MNKFITILLASMLAASAFADTTTTTESVDAVVKGGVSNVKHQVEEVDPETGDTTTTTKEVTIQPAQPAKK